MKKILVLVLALAMVLSTAAFAVTSKTTQELIVVDKVETKSGEAVDPSFLIKLPELTDPNDPTDPVVVATAQLKKIIDFVAGGQPVAKYFASEPEKEAELKALLPEGTDIAKLEMNEFSPVIIEHGDVVTEDIVTEDIVVSFKFATVYADGQAIVAAYGIIDDVTGEIERFYLPAEVVEGEVRITFSPEVLALASGKNTVLAILSMPVVE